MLRQCLICGEQWPALIFDEINPLLRVQSHFHYIFPPRRVFRSRFPPYLSGASLVRSRSGADRGPGENSKISVLPLSRSWSSRSVGFPEFVRPLVTAPPPRFYVQHTLPVHAELTTGKPSNVTDCGLITPSKASLLVPNIRGSDCFITFDL